MKLKLHLLILALLSVLLLAPDRSWASATVLPADPAVTSTNSVASTNAPTTVNQLMIDILTGVKTAGAEAYSVSKSALRQAYGFVEREAPEVLKEFLRWKLFNAALWVALFSVIGGILYYWSRRLKKLAEACPAPTREHYGYGYDDHGKSAYTAGRYVAIIAATAIMLVGVSTNLFEVVKIAVAPRVYIIEYVADSLSSNQGSPGR